MWHRRPLLIAAGLSPAARAELVRYIGDVVTVQYAGWPAPEPTGDRYSGADGFLIELEPTDVRVRLSYIRNCARAQPLGPVIVCCEPYRGATHHLYEAVRAGATTLALRGYDVLTDVVRAAFLDWQFGAVCRATLEDILPRLPKQAWPFMEYCVNNVRHALTVADVAEAIDIHPRRLHRLLRNAGLPAPVAAISWSRLFVATRLITAHDLSVERAALMVGFATGSGFRNMLKHYLGVRPLELRRPDAFRVMMDRFVDVGASTPGTGAGQAPACAATATC